MKILVTGANGQLGLEIKDIVDKDSSNDYVFTDKSVLNIIDKKQIEIFFEVHNFDYCINCAAYTAVDLCENNELLALEINFLGVKYLAEACKKYKTVLIHVSTDFVFDGNQNMPYDEFDLTNPCSVYGISKLKGEVIITDTLTNYFIFRTSWLYSSFGNNFVKTMLRLATFRDSIGVVDDQIGTPTYARDLAKVITKIINERLTSYGLYHFSNEGIASWYDFSYAIFDLTNIKVKLKPISTAEFPLPARRPNYSVMNKQKIKKSFGITIPYWKSSLVACIDKLNK